MLDRFASELPSSMWQTRRVQCYPGLVAAIENRLLQIASKSHDVTDRCLGSRLVGVVLGTPDRCRC